eukprot:CAMPEP_0172702358 /NCGR_PEP_ID=MMETSP1074-20121228/34011_1 /TAXON_ID=2916 /ORGANISM="Ceratium fusus, Strain PA161109" /LENGTH=50 /DNA_ID=CAMNT_0013524041 /DNA_START=28 /DNA_END=177 /DNA_ORIENTATION=+
MAHCKNSWKEISPLPSVLIDWKSFARAFLRSSTEENMSLACGAKPNFRGA